MARPASEESYRIPLNMRVGRVHEEILQAALRRGARTRAEVVRAAIERWGAAERGDAVHLEGVAARALLQAARDTGYEPQQAVIIATFMLAQTADRNPKEVAHDLERMAALLTAAANGATGGGGQRGGESQDRPPRTARRPPGSPRGR